MDDLLWRVLTLAAKRGYIGATREDFFREIRGVMYDNLEKAILDLERRGLVSVEWLADSRFIVSVTEIGSVEVRDEYDRRLQTYQERIADQRRKAGLDRV